MIRNSFIFLERLSHISEQNIWKQGIFDWNAFREARKIKGISPKRKNYYDKQLTKARKHFIDYDSNFFHDRFPKSEMWRLYDDFSDDCIFLDIETSGYYGDITVIGVYDGNTTKTLIKDRSLTKDNLRSIVRPAKLLVTFNGLSFDVPCINRYFNTIIPKIPHLDLRFPLAKLGFTGGLKKIEEQLKIRRSSGTEGMCGEDAIMLWNEYLATGNTDHLERLVEYNTEDVINLEPISRFVFDSMKKRVQDNFL